MTIEEAINILTNYISQDYDSDLCDAMRIAIKTMKEQIERPDYRKP